MVIETLDVGQCQSLVQEVSSITKGGTVIGSILEKCGQLSAGSVRSRPISIIIRSTFQAYKFLTSVPVLLSTGTMIRLEELAIVREAMSVEHKSVTAASLPNVNLLKRSTRVAYSVPES